MRLGYAYRMRKIGKDASMVFPNFQTSSKIFINSGLVDKLVGAEKV